MGESISEVRIGSILKPSGSFVKADDELLEIESDKVNQLLFSPQNGTVSYAVNSGETVKIGQVIGYIDSEEKIKEPVEPPKKEEIKTEVQEEKEEAPARITKEKYIDTLSKKRPEPLVVPKEFREKPKENLEEKTGLAAKETRQKMSNIRRVIAKRMVEAQHIAAMLTTFNEVNMAPVMELREKYKKDFQEKFGVRLGFMSFFTKVVVEALEAFPILNSYIDGDEIVQRHYYNLGIAVSTERGLFVPVIKDCDKKSFAEIEKEIEQFALLAREGRISIQDLQGGGFTITNGGVFGSLLSTPILNPPQSGILGMHKITKRPVVIEDQIVIKPMMYLALSYDHRLVDGKEAVSFLVHIKNSLEDPARLVIGL